MKVLVWDLPVRLFHWLLAGSFVAAWLTSDSDRWLDMHVFAGYLMAGLLVFRLVWGFAGSRYARFSSFAFRPGEALTYLRGVLRRDAKRYIGHNPAGSWAIYLLLALGLMATVSGLLVLGGEERHSPLAGVVSFTTGDALKELHEVMAWLMLGLVGVHLLGVLAESWLHQENLPRAMLTGYKQGSTEEGVVSGRKLIGLLLLLAVAGFGVWYFKGYVSASEARPYLPFAGKQLPDNKLWRAECGSCHLAYHPTLLPVRSWERVMREQNDHFGETLGLDVPTTKEILAFLTKYAADTHMTEAAYKIDKSIPAGAQPLRITETLYWKKKHEEIPAGTWRNAEIGSKANCGACHLDAERGTFEDAAMQISRTK
jgi:cytochrome b